MNDFQIHHRANGDFDVEHLEPQAGAERPQERVSGASGIRLAENGEGHQAGRTARASDLPCEIEDDGFITVWPERWP